MQSRQSEKLRQVNQEFEVSLSYIARLSQKEKPFMELKTALLCPTDFYWVHLGQSLVSGFLKSSQGIPGTSLAEKLI